MSPKKSAGSNNNRSRKRTISPPHSTRPRKKTTSPAESSDSSQPSKLKISYENNDRTDRIIEWLTNNVEDRISLFSDVQDASTKGRQTRTIAKASKMSFYRKIARAIFEDDAEEKDSYARDPERYAKSVENRLRGLKQKYRDFNKTLGQTGAGLRAEDIEEDSELHNLVACLSVDFPYWERLHGFWRTLPNFNPYTISSEPGQNLSAQAQEFITGGGRSSREMGGDADGQGEHMSELEGHSVQQSQSTSTSPTTTPYLFANDPKLPQVRQLLLGPLGRSGSRSVSRGRTSSRGRLRGSPFYSKDSSPFTVTSSLSTPTDGGETLAADCTALAAKRYERLIAEQEAKRTKYETTYATAKVNADLELEKEKLKQADRVLEVEREKMKLENAERMLALQKEKEQEERVLEMEREKMKLEKAERVLVMQHNREREKEAHEIRVLEMQFALQKRNDQTSGPGLLVNPLAGDVQGGDGHSGSPDLFATPS